MNTVDLILLLVFALAVFSGWWRGFVLGALDLAGLIVAFGTALFGYASLADWLEQRNALTGVWTMPISFIVIFLFVRWVFNRAAHAVLVYMRPDAHRHPLNRTLGMLPGAVNGLVYASIVAVILLAVPFTDGLSADARHSKAAVQLTGYVQKLEAELTPIFGEAMKSMTGTTVDPGSHEFVKLPYTAAHTRERPDLEAEMLQMINKERNKAGLGLLRADPELKEVARAHSRDMFARGYFAHMTPDSLSPFDRIKRAGVRYVTAGENLALAPTLPLAHQGLMNSPGHRANILQPLYGRVGIGIIDGGMYGIMVTQNFRN